MKRPRITSIFYIIALASFWLSACAHADNQPQRPDTLNKALAAYKSGFKTAGDFTIINNFKNSAQGKIFNTLIAQNGDKRVQIEITSGLNKDEALSYSKIQYAIIQHLYGPRQIQYPGSITNSTTCPENKKPTVTSIEIMGKPTKVLLANASDRYVLGVWDDDLIKQKAAFMIFYDEKNATCYQIIIFQPVDNPDLKGLLAIPASFKIK